MIDKDIKNELDLYLDLVMTISAICERYHCIECPLHGDDVHCYGNKIYNTDNFLKMKEKAHAKTHK